MSILKIILIGILCLAPEKDGWVRINGDNYISFSFPSRGERFKKEVNNMSFFTTAVTGLKTVVTAIGAGVAVWGVINLLEGYGNDNPGAKSQGIKQLMSGGGIVIVAQTVIPQLTSLFS